MSPEAQEAQAIRRGDYIIYLAQVGRLPPRWAVWLWFTLWRQRYTWRWN